LVLDHAGKGGRYVFILKRGYKMYYTAILIMTLLSGGKTLTITETFPYWNSQPRAMERCFEEALKFQGPIRKWKNTKVLSISCEPGPLLTSKEVGG